jgi:hypothetical protein
MIARFANGVTVSVHAAKKSGSTSLHRIIFNTLNSSWGVEFRKGNWIRDTRFANSLSRFCAKNPNIKIDSRCAVIRDPLSRMRSIYKHSAVSHKRSPFKNNQIPSWEEFVINFRQIQKTYTNIRNHSQPQCSTIGDPAQYDCVITLDKLDTEFPQWLEFHSGVAVKPVHKKRTRSNTITVTESQAKLIQEYFAEDYEAYKDYFSK